MECEACKSIYTQGKSDVLWHSSPDIIHLRTSQILTHTVDHNDTVTSSKRSLCLLEVCKYELAHHQHHNIIGSHRKLVLFCSTVLPGSKLVELSPPPHYKAYIRNVGADCIKYISTIRQLNFCETTKCNHCYGETLNKDGVIRTSALMHIQLY